MKVLLHPNKYFIYSFLEIIEQEDENEEDDSESEIEVVVDSREDLRKYK